MAPRVQAGACWDVDPDSGPWATDSCGVPAHIPSAPISQHARATATNVWLPVGHHWDLHIEHDSRVSTGSFVGPQHWKWTWHITVSPWETVDSMRQVLHEKSAEVHFVIGGRAGVEHPVVIQCLPLNEYGKGLVHPSGTPETNRAWTIQCEVCANPADIGTFAHYAALANLAALVTHGKEPRVPVPRRLARAFSNTKRFTPDGYPRVTGHHGHEHVPNNDHTDPTSKFDGRKLLELVESAPHGL